MRRGLRLVALAACAGAGACNLPPKDPFGAAEYAVRRDDLLAALRAYDSVPVSHERYPEARAAAGEVERRMRRCHERLAEALRLRGEWRDEQALAVLLEARDLWSMEPSLSRWIEATERRLELFEGKGAPSVGPAKLVTAAETPPASGDESVAPDAQPSVESDADAAEPPLDVGSVEGEPEGSGAAVARFAPMPSGETAPVAVVRSRSVERPDSVEPEPPTPAGPEVAGEVAPAVRTSPPATESRGRPSSGRDDVGPALVAIEDRLVRGELGGAISDLMQLSNRFPDDSRVRRRLGRLLHQRALANYGHGGVDAAIADWRRVLALWPDDARTKQLLERALAETERR